MSEARTIDFEITRYGNEMSVRPVSDNGKSMIDAYEGLWSIKRLDGDTLIFDDREYTSILFEMFDHDMAAALSF